MFTISHRRRVTPPPSPNRPSLRRGVALVFVMVFVIAMAALAMSSIFMASSNALLAKSYDHERDLRFAADAGLAIGKARVNGNPLLLVMPADTPFRKILSNAQLFTADSTPLPGIRVNVYVGLTGSTSGQTGRFASIVSEARDENGTGGFIRRLEMAQESFAKYAYWSNSEINPTTGGLIYFGGGDEIWGPVWSNDIINVHETRARFHDEVGTAKTVAGAQYGTFLKGYDTNQKVIALPSTAVLGTLQGQAAQGGLVISGVAVASANEKKVLDRIEFVAFDIDGKNGNTSPGEGFYRWYKGKPGMEAAVRGEWEGTLDQSTGLPKGNAPVAVPDRTVITRCGDWHYAPMNSNGGNNNNNGNNPTAPDTAPKFYPASVHGQTWFYNQIQQALQQRKITPAGYQNAKKYADDHVLLDLRGIMMQPNARCYLAGDPHLVATDRPLGGARGAPLFGNYTAADVQKGGEDSTFTKDGNFGSWQTATTTPNPTLLALRPWDVRYLFAIGQAWNANTKGVIYSTGNVGVSGVVNGSVTLYAKGDIVILDDLTYANNPAVGLCRDILGLVSDFEVVVADNAMNTPVPLLPGTNGDWGWRNVAPKDLYLHAVIMALNTSFRVEDYQTEPLAANTCGVKADGSPQVNGRGCLYLSGGIIQNSRNTVGDVAGAGFIKRYTYDRCAVRNPPPYFPTTGRFTDNRYLELDPVGFDPRTYFLSLTPSGP